MTMIKNNMSLNLSNFEKPNSKTFLPLPSLQFFAEDPPTDPPNDPPTDPPADPPADPPQDPPADPPQDPPADPPKDDKKYTQKEFEAEIARRVAAEKKRADDKVKEAEKLAKMNADQKKQYEYDKLQRELDEYKKKDAFHSLSKEATKMLSEEAITADDDILEFVVKETAEDTQTAVKSFVTLINAKVEEGVKKALSGKPPKAAPGTPGAKNPFSKEHWNLTEQGKIYAKDPTLYKQLQNTAKK